MPELRKDPALGRWVIIATERVRRPGDFVGPRPPRRPGPCAFCAGREHETPPELLAYRDPGSRGADGPGWRVRVVPSRFPALRVEGEPERRGQDMYDLMNGIGAHELVLTSPAHDVTLAALPPSALEDVLRACRERILDLRRDARFRAVALFQPHDGDAAPVGHPHLALVATPVLPLTLATELDRARAYHDYRERCLFCDMLQQELDAKDRLVVETPRVVAFAPFASAAPFETWLVPRQHRAAFEQADDDDLRDLARTLHVVLRKLAALVGDPPYALRLHSAPFASGESPSFHWHVEIVPALGAGAETGDGSGLDVNPMPPEDAARFLRDTAG